MRTASVRSRRSVQALLAARLDRLGPASARASSARRYRARVLRRARSIELLPAEPARRARGTCARSPTAGSCAPSGAPGDALRFHHILIRDVAYRTHPEGARGELHEQLRGLAERGPRASTSSSATTSSRRSATATSCRAEPEVVALGRRAAERLATPARRALLRGEAARARACSARGGADADQRGRRPDVLLDLGCALSETGDFEDAERALALALADADDEAMRARVLIELSYRRLLVDADARLDDMIEVADRAAVVSSRSRTRRVCRARCSTRRRCTGRAAGRRRWRRRWRRR